MIFTVVFVLLYIFYSLEMTWILNTFKSEYSDSLTEIKDKNFKSRMTSWEEKGDYQEQEENMRE